MSTSPSPSRVREVLDLALERPSHERPAFVAGVCGRDERLHDEVVSLLRALDGGGELLEPPAPGAEPRAAPLTGLAFGHYRVEERVGEGGMGVVYRAQDTRLGRTVAVKALPPALAGDAHRRARFEHEARVLASLNHPNIGAIHGVEETARGPVLVLEFVPGQTLARRLARGRMAADEAVATAVQIARGLEAAHAAGVVHRDLKPSNIQLSPEGGVKILDFGVAKQAHAVEPDAGRTLPGTLIGTAAYMSPEQARGRPVDRRTDLWALGCVVFEMLAGKRAFDGPTQSDTLASVLRAEPEWSLLPAATPAGALRVLRRCLEKDPDLRQRDAGDVALELSGRGEAGLSEPARGARAWTWAAAIAGAGAIGVWLGASVWGGRSVPLRGAPVRFELNLDPERAVSVTQGGAMAISRDGRLLVFAGGPADRTRLYARRLDSHDTVELAGTDDAAEPCFSPDGRWIAFRSGEQLRRVPAAGGGAEVLVPRGIASLGLAWDERGIVFGVPNPLGLRRLGPDGRVDVVTSVDPAREAFHAHPELLPGGDAVLFTVVTTAPGEDSSRVEAMRFRSGERRIVVPGASGARFLPPDRLVFWQAGALMTAPFDPATLRLTDTPAVALRPLAGGEFAQPPRFAVSPAGVLATLPGNIRYDRTRLAWFEPDGSWTELAQGGPGIDAPRLSPDGTKIAMLMGRASGDVWVHDLQRSTRLRLTTGDCHHQPAWDREGDRLIVTAAPPDAPARLERMAADGSALEVLWEAPDGAWVYPTDVAPDGRVLVSLIDAVQSPMDLFLFDPRTREAPTRLMPTAGRRYGARLCPDGTMIAYTSEETGTMEVYLHRYPSLEPKVRVSAAGGYRPVWSGDGRRLFYRYLDRVMAVDVAIRGKEITLSPPSTVAEHLPDARYDVDREGRRLLLPRPSGEMGRQTRINVDLNWEPAR